MAEIQNRSQEADRAPRLETAGCAAQAAATMLADVFQTIRERGTERASQHVQEGENVVSHSVGAPRNPCDTPVNPRQAELSGGFLNIPRIWQPESGPSGARTGPSAAELNAFANRPSLPRLGESIEGLALNQAPIIRGIGTRDNTIVRIGTDRNGRPNVVQDHLGTWRSEDGNTWRIGGVERESGPYRVRRGTPSIEGGNYVFRDSDYGVTTSMSPNETTTRSIRTAAGQEFSATFSAGGEMTHFREGRETWARVGEFNPTGENVWRNSRGEERRGVAEMTTYGAFRFTHADTNGERRTEENRSPELDQIIALRAGIQRIYPGITFAAPGETTTDEGVGYRNGMSTYSELTMLMSVLDRNPHLRFDSPQNSVRIWFAAEATGTDGAATHWGQYSRCEGGCHPRGGGEASAANLVITPRARLVTEGMRGLEGLLLHELAHHEQGQLYGHGNDGWGTGAQRTRDIQRQARELGFIPSDLRTRNDNGRETEGRNLLQDRWGRVWAYDGEGNNDYRWRQVEGGRLVGGVWVGGRPGDRVISGREMNRIARVRPATNYNISADEGQAEVFSQFRISADRDGPNRRTLFLNNDRLYRIAQAQDQRNLGPGRLRDVTGDVVPDSAENRERIRQTEEGWRRAARANNQQRATRQNR